MELTLTCLVLLMVLITACTLEQASLGMFASVEKYFRSAFLYVHAGPLKLPWFPAGGAVGLVLLLQLVLINFAKVQWTWRKSGILLTHAGLVLLVLGEFVTGGLAIETRMAISEGETLNYTESGRQDELFVADVSAAEADTVYQVPLSRVKEGAEIAHAEWPFTMRVREFHRNAAVGPRPAALNLPAGLADQGLGKDSLLKAESPVSSDDERNMPAAFIEVSEGGRSLGTWLLSAAFGREQRFQAGGREFSFGLRPVRRMLPFSLTLKDFRHDVYPGTQIPRNFSSQVRLINPATGEDRDVLIWMNNPLRYMGRTFYQASFGQNDTLSVLQVVENPGWLMPYISFGLMAVGLMIHFLLTLMKFKPVGAGASAPQKHEGKKAAVAAALFLLCIPAAQAKAPAGVDAWGRLPVLDGGRIKPLDSVARSSLLVLRGKQSIRREGASISPAEWLLDLAARPREADRMKVFRIDDPDVLGLLGQRGGSDRYYAFEVMAPKLSDLEAQAQRAQSVPAQQRTRFERAVLDLFGKVDLYQSLKNTLAVEDTKNLGAELETFEAAVAASAGAMGAHGAGAPAPRQREALQTLMNLFERYRYQAQVGRFRPLPPPPGAAAEDWMLPGEALVRALSAGAPVPAELKSYAAVLDAWRAGDKAGFAVKAGELSATLAGERPLETTKARREASFNSLDPFGKGMALYVLALLLAAASWMVRPERLRSAAFWTMGAAFLLHSAGVFGRMVIQGRPPVTNLYSSAVFVGWGAVLLALGLEWAHKRGIASAVGSLVGFCTLIVAHHLSMSGDTMEMMQAVLDSNFWLATHVITITIGYSATFLAGALGMGWIVGARSGKLSKENSRSLVQMTYGTLCFAMFFSFVGTVLGGIWADQSWGRFWGWDPKENGALLLVLWIAVILHARWAGYARERGIMVMAVFGNVVTAMAWFGVNMLGVGLHSYGFMDKAVVWLAAFTALMFAFMAAGAAAAVPGESRP